MAGVTVNELRDLGTLYDAMTDSQGPGGTARPTVRSSDPSKAAESVAEAASALQVWQTEAGNPETEAAYQRTDRKRHGRAGCIGGMAERGRGRKECEKGGL